MSDLLGSAAWSKDQGYLALRPDRGRGLSMQGRFLLLGECWNAHGNLHVRAPDSTCSRLRRRVREKASRSSFPTF